MDGNRVGSLPRPVAAHHRQPGQPGAGEATAARQGYQPAPMGSRRGPCLGGRTERAGAAQGREAEGASVMDINPPRGGFFLAYNFFTTDNPYPNYSIKRTPYRKCTFFMRRSSS